MTSATNIFRLDWFENPHRDVLGSENISPEFTRKGSPTSEVLGSEHRYLEFPTEKQTCKK